MAKINQYYVRVVLPLALSLVFSTCSSKKEEPKPSEPATTQNQQTPSPEVSQPPAVTPPADPITGGRTGTVAPEVHRAPPRVQLPVIAPPSQTAAPTAPVTPAEPVPTDMPAQRPGALPRVARQNDRQSRRPAPAAPSQTSLTDQSPATQPTDSLSSTMIQRPVAPSLEQSLERKVYGFLDYSGNASNPCWGTEGQRPAASGRARQRAGLSCPAFSVTLHCRRWSGTETTQNIDLSYLEASVVNILVQKPNFNASADRMCATIITAGNSGSRAIESGSSVARALEAISASRHPEDNSVAGLTLPSQFNFRDALVDLIPKFDRNFFNICTRVAHRQSSTTVSSGAAQSWIHRSANDYCSRIAESWIIPQCVAPLFDRNESCSSSCEGLWDSYLANRAERNLGANDWLESSLRPTLRPLNARSETARLVAKQNLLVSVRSHSGCAGNVRAAVESLIQNHHP